MKFKIEDKFVNDYLYSQSQKKKQIEKRKRKMRIENEIENGFSKIKVNRLVRRTSPRNAHNRLADI